MLDRFPFLRDLAELIKKINTRFLVIGAAIIVLALIMIYRLFTLQIINGEDYLNNFQLRIRRVISISSARGNIYDRNGKLLAYNELAYSVTLKDELEDNSRHNSKLNDIINRAVDIIEAHGDTVTTDFKVAIDENDNFYFTVEGSSLLRFLADVYGYDSTDKLTDEERAKTADAVIADLCGEKRFAIGDYISETDAAQNVRRVFEPGRGYENNKKRLLEVVTIRYLLNLNQYQKYIATPIATDVSEETVAAILENTDTIEGLNIEDDTVRRYVDSKYFSQILGYTGKIDTDELKQLSLTDPSYTANDIVGKSGIEKSMEEELQGKKGEKTVYVNNLGKELETTSLIQPTAGNDVFLTIDKDLQEAAYDILEKKLSDILLEKIRNLKEYIPEEDATSADIIIPIYDVYYSVIKNNVLSLEKMSQDDAEPVQKAVWQAFMGYRSNVFSKISSELLQDRTPYNALTKEYKDYESYIIQKLKNDGVLVTDRIDKEDSTYIAWTKDETISMAEFLSYAISQNWVNASLLEMDEKYADSSKVFKAILSYLDTALMKDNDFSKHIFKFMILNDALSGQDICRMLLEQGCVQVSEDEKNAVYSGAETAYTFMTERIRSLDLTPAQLNLDPYSGSMVITDVKTGDVLALVSYPSFDNNKMANGVDPVYYESLRNDLSKPLINYATQQKTAPGSTFKMVTATAGLMENAITTDTIVTCTGTFTKIGQPYPHCWIWPDGAHGQENVTAAIKNSCNVFFYDVGYHLSLDENEDYVSDLGIEKLQKYASMYGLNEKSGIEIEEADSRMSDEDAVRSAIGQGSANYTTVDLARYVTTVANSGTCYNLTLISKIKSTDGELIRDNSATVRNVINMDPSYWNAIHTGMRGVVQGMSFFAGFPVNVAGKTGTAQESALRPNHALFVCYAPYEAPSIAVATRVANGYTSSYAAQITQEVLKYYFGLEKKDDIMSSSENIVTEAGD